MTANDLYMLLLRRSLTRAIAFYLDCQTQKLKNYNVYRTVQPGLSSKQRSHYSSIKTPSLAASESRIDFTILLITYKALNNLAPAYIKDILSSYKPKRSLRSS